MERVRQAKRLLEALDENPRVVPRLLLRKGLGVEPRKFGWQALPNALSKWYHRRVPDGEPGRVIWDADWDLLVVVDSCRPAWLRALEGEYDWLTDVIETWSVGSHSHEWVTKTFTDAYREEIEGTVYVTANPYSRQAPTEWFRRFEDVAGIDWDGDSAVPPAHIVTDRAIEVAREESWERCLVHYMQPHKPIFEPGESRTDPRIDQRWQPTGTFWRQYIDGQISKRELRAAFISNLRYVLAEVDTLLANVDAPSAVVTSDHGQALGERFLWSHRRGVVHPAMRQVPWVECSARDTETLASTGYETTGDIETQRADRLVDLGYR